MDKTDLISFKLGEIDTGSLKISNLEFKGDTKAFNKVLVLLFSGDIVDGLVPVSDELEDDLNAQDAAVVMNALREMVKQENASPLGNQIFTETETPPSRTSLGGKARDVSGGFTITAEDNEELDK